MSFPIVAATPYLDDEERDLERLRALTNGSSNNVEVLKNSADLMQRLERQIDRLMDDNKKLMKEFEEVSARNKQLLARTQAIAGTAPLKRREAK